MEALLFAAGRPLSLDELASTLDCDKKQIRSSIKELAKMYSDSSIEILVIQDTAQMRLRDDFIKIASNITKPVLDKDELKTASLIGYYQPLLQSDLVTMIGTKAYTHVARLKELELIESEREGRSYVLKTAPGFAKFFGIKANS